jgi:hypothetical protein
MSPRNPGPAKTRFTLWLPDALMEDMERIQTATGKESIAEVVREAVGVYRDLLKARDGGVDLYFEHAQSGKRGPVWILPGPPPVRRRKK